ncbi:hypothetical protein ABZT17_11080 [Streptomyces sp. NPDC005648]|uniref:hypothetical protein n=1 Tax=Streptomyces sp. NPDC005648 TaxID=3157044 RepID=UPI0033BBFA9C
MNAEEPQLAGDFWVYPQLGDTSDDSVRVSVAIAVESPSDMQDTDVAVDLVADGQSLNLAEGPAPGLLPTIELVGANAYALYRFDNPDHLTPATVTVTVRGGSAAFDVSPPVA